MAQTQEHEVTVAALGGRGDGLAAFGDETAFVPFAAPGDTLRIRLTRDKAGLLIGRIAKIVVPGPDRAAPPCPHFGTCGGCALQHLTIAAYRAWKIDQLRSALERAGVEAPDFEPMAAAPPGSRRRADLSALRKPAGLALGYNERASHRIVDLAACPVLRPGLTALLAPLRDLLAALTRPADTAEIRLAETDSGIDMLLVGALALTPDLRQRIAGFATAHDLARIALRRPKQGGAEVLAMPRRPRVICGGVPIDVPPGAFLQATREGEAALAGFALAALAGARQVADLYCGIGTFALPLARAGARVFAVDAERAQIVALDAAARAAVLNGIKAEARDLDARPLDPGALNRFDAVLFDPPRAGARAQAGQLALSRVGRIVAVSCHPPSFARDAALLIEGGYRLERLLPVDQFLWSPHLELAALFTRP